MLTESLLAGGSVQTAEDKKKITNDQFSVLIKAVEDDPSLGSARGGGKPEKLVYIEKWGTLAKRLNSVENGTTKSVQKWQQAWRDWKSNTRRKVKAAIDSAAIPLTSMEKRVFHLVGLDDYKLDEIGKKEPCTAVEHKDFKDTRSIADEPLSSDDDAEPLSKMQSSPSISALPEETNSIRNKRAKCQNDVDRVQIKRRRIQMTSDKGSVQARILSRLTALECSRRQMDRRQTKLLQDMAEALNRQADAADRQVAAADAQAHALSRIADMLEKKNNK